MKKKVEWQGEEEENKKQKQKKKIKFITRHSRGRKKTISQFAESREI